MASPEPILWAGTQLREGDKRLTSLLLANFLRSFSVELLPPTAKGRHCSSLTTFTRLNTLKVMGTQFREQFILKKWKSLGIWRQLQMVFVL